jgi:RNA recognition motif-containing protein
VHTRDTLRQSVFLRNLPFDVTEEELIVLFAAPAKMAGSALVGVRVTRDKETGMGRGVGFVSFGDELGMRAVIDMQGELKIRHLVIRMERSALSSPPPVLEDSAVARYKYGHDSLSSRPYREAQHQNLLPVVVVRVIAPGRSRMP